MSDDFSDYDLENVVRCIAAQLGISGCGQESGKTAKELFSEIEKRCPGAAQVLLERTFQKDQLREYLANSPPFPRHNGNIIGEGDPEFMKHWDRLVASYPLLIEEIQKCKS